MESEFLARLCKEIFLDTDSLSFIKFPIENDFIQIQFGQKFQINFGQKIQISFLNFSRLFCPEKQNKVKFKYEFLA
jgi:hypothetical protein